MQSQVIMSRPGKMDADRRTYLNNLTKKEDYKDDIFLISASTFQQQHISEKKHNSVNLAS